MKNIIFIFTIFVLLNCKDEVNDNIDISIYSNYEYDIGKENGILPLYGGPCLEIFDDPDFEDLTHYEIELIGLSNNRYQLDCRLWNANEPAIYTFCNFKQNLKMDEVITNQFEHSIKYKEYNLTIHFYLNDMRLYKTDRIIPFLYSPRKVINLNESQTTINLTFKIDKYNNEPLYLRTDEDKYQRIIKMDSCQREGKYLNCYILRENFDVFATKQTIIRVLYIDELGSDYFGFARYIYINYPDIEKEDVFCELNKITNSEIDLDNFVTFSTNITDIDIIQTTYFELIFPPKIIIVCFFIKHNNSDPLYLTCNAHEGIDYSVSFISTKEYNNLHYKYNFILIPGKDEESVNILKPQKTYIYSIFSDTLNFTSQKSLEIYFGIKNAYKINSLRFNENGTDLICQDINDIKKCTVKKSHFKNKESGYYYILHKNNANKFSIDYETFGVNVILPDDSDDDTDDPDDTDHSDNTDGTDHTDHHTDDTDHTDHHTDDTDHTDHSSDKSDNSSQDGNSGKTIKDSLVLISMLVYIIMEIV